VGCGTGEFCLWAAMNGATHALGIEPEIDGSTSGSLKTFHEMITKLQLGSVVRASNQLLESIVGQKPFDIVLLYNVINHLDELSVQNLPNDQKAVVKYLDYIEMLWSLIHPDGILILADCARSNFFGNLGLKSPFVPTVEWKKHQDPTIWLDLFMRKGFSLWDMRWSSLYPFGKLSENYVVHFFTKSHFVLRMKKSLI
jgi:hypothetical protein